MNVPMRIMSHKLDVFTFGKFKGKTVRHVIEHQPSYILWLEEQKIVKFSQEILDNALDNDVDVERDDHWYHDNPNY